MCGEAMRSSYLALSISEIEKRTKILYEKMLSCDICPRKCHVNRMGGQVGACKVGNSPFISSYGPHFGEESFLVGQNGSGTVFFTGCNLKCVYCQNWTISQLCNGEQIKVEQLASIMLEIQSLGCHNLNLVTPTHQIAMILEALSIAIKSGLHIPIVYNCGGYESVETLQLLESIVDIYMPDFKYANDDLALKYSGVRDYVEVVRDALKEMYRQVGPLKAENGIATRGVFVRHLVLPNNLSTTQKVCEVISSVNTEIPVNIMKQYHPIYQAYEYPELSRRITSAEFIEAVQLAKKYGLNIVS